MLMFRNAADAVQKLIAVLKNATSDTDATGRRATSRGRANTINLLKDDIMTAAEQFAPVAYKLVSTAKNVGPKANESDTRNNMLISSSNAGTFTTSTVNRMNEFFNT